MFLVYKNKVYDVINIIEICTPVPVYLSKEREKNRYFNEYSEGGGDFVIEMEDLEESTPEKIYEKLYINTEVKDEL